MTVLLASCAVVLAWLPTWSILQGRRTRPHAARSGYGILLGALAVLPLLLPLLEPTRPQIWGLEGMNPALRLVEGAVPAGAFGLLEAVLFGQGPYVRWWIGLVVGGWLANTVLLFSALAGVRQIGREGVDVRTEVEGTLASNDGDRVLPRGLRLVEHPSVRAPALIVSRKPTIVLPTDWRDAPAAALRSALLHELEHVRARDHWRRLGSQIARGALWFHPLAWHFARRYEQAIERLADERVLRRGVPSTAYAESLLYWAARHSNLRIRHLELGVAKHLGQRVERVLSFEPRRRQASDWTALLVFGLLMMCAGFVGGTDCGGASNATTSAAHGPTH